MGARSMNIFNSYKTERSLLRATVLLLLVVGGFLVLVDQLSTHWGLGIGQRVADDFAGGMIAASIFYLYERRTRRQFLEQLRLIDLMNHHIRNALQPLMFVPCEPETAVQKQLVEECIDHIDWALREILPGKSREQFVARTPHFTGIWSRPKIQRTSLGSMKSWNSGCELESSKPQAFSGQWFETWFDAWRNRNRTVPDERVVSSFSNPVKSSPWENCGATFRQRKQGGRNA